MAKRQKILVIVGPTASGKSALAVELARKFGGEVISADSRQVYKGLDIGTGKITRKEMRGVSHHLLDVASPKKTFTAHDFVEAARRAIADITQRGKLPIVAGGTGFYIDALLGRIVLPNVPANPKLRAQLAKKTPAQLFLMLKKFDPRRARAMATSSERGNKIRLLRAIEIAHALGHVPMMEVVSPSFDALWIGIAPPMKELEKKIRVRLFGRIRDGMIAEAKRLHSPPAGGELSYKRMEELGLEYRHLARLLQNKIPRQEFELALARDIRRYAKRQLSYWKRNKDIEWFSSPTSKQIPATVRHWLK
jgi:tRNA dimethylallyltransferase